MPASLLKTIATQNKTYAQKAASPNERIIDRIKSVRVDRFEKVGEQMSVVGTDLSTGQKLRMFREWSRSPRVQDANPLEKAPDTVQPGGVIMFTDIREITGIDGETTFTSDGFVTVSRNADREDAEIIHDAQAFVDAPETLENGEMVQMFNITRTDQSEKVTTPEEFFQAFKTFFEERESVEDSVVVRGYSKTDGVSSAIRVLVGPTDTFRDRMTRFLEEDHYIEMAGDIEGTFEVNGRELVASLKDPENDTIWEVIPVTGLRKRLTVKDDPEFSQRLQDKAAALFQNFVHMGEGALTGCRRVSLGLRHTSYGRGARFKDVVSAFHAPGRAVPLAMLDTPHVNGLDKVFPGYGNDRLYSVGDDVPEMDFSAYIDDLAGELQRENIDFLNQPGIHEIDPAEEEAAAAAEPEAETDIDLALFEPDVAEKAADDGADVRPEAQEPDDQDDIDFTAAADADIAVSEENPEIAPEEVAEDELDDLNIDLAELSEQAEAPEETSKTKEDDTQPAPQDAEAEATDGLDDLNIDLADLDEANSSQDTTDIDEAEPAEEEPEADAKEAFDDLEVDIASFDDTASEPEPAPREPKSAPAPTPKPKKEKPAAPKKSEPEPAPTANEADDSVGFIDIGDEGDEFDAEDFLSGPDAEEGEKAHAGDQDAELEQSLASTDAPSEEPKDSAEEKSESEELIGENFDAIAGALKF